MTRTPAVAGMFYELDPEALTRSIERCFLCELGPGSLPGKKDVRAAQVLGLVSPHAGYMYSGAAAAHAFHRLAEDGVPDTAVLLGPTHRGLGPAVAVGADTEWTTPLGALQTDQQTANSILELCDFAQRDDIAHMEEHSLEVQLPFLQYIGGDSVKIVPISIACLSEDDAVALSSDLGQAIGKSLAGKSAVVIASTDFTHYESQANAESKDSLAMDRILKRDGPGLLREVYGKSISMCGVAGTAVMLEACKALGAKQARKLTYYTSGDVTGDMSQVVGYGALSIEL